MEKLIAQQRSKSNKDLEKASLECRRWRLTAETQSAQRGRRGLNSLQLCALSPRSLRLGGESDFPYIQLKVFIALLTFFACLSLCLFAPVTATAQTPASEAQLTGGVRLRVRLKVDDKEKGLQRKRFYLIKGSAEENKALIEKINQHPFLTRECYYRKAGASEAFIKWLAEFDCESVYCRLIEEKFVTGATAVPEFRAAYERGVKEYKKPELGRLWLTTNLTDEIRDGFYRQRQAALKALISEAETLSKAPVMSVMTDGKGTAFFTDLLPGTYLITNLLPAEFGNNSLLWRCEVKVKAGPFKTVTVATDKNCVVVEKPLPACDAGKPMALKR